MKKPRTPLQEIATERNYIKYIFSGMKRKNINMNLLTIEEKVLFKRIDADLNWLIDNFKDNTKKLNLKEKIKI
jgi:hypothetical protein